MDVTSRYPPPVEKCCRDTLQTNRDILIHVLYEVSSAPRDREKAFVKGEDLRLLRINSSIKTFVENIATFKREAIHKILLPTHSQKGNIKKGHKSSSNETKQKTNLVLYNTILPRSSKSQRILMRKWYLIQQHPSLNQIFREPPIVSYRKGRSLTDVLVRAKI